jgi:2-polyprenyl-3-methyl-5-hydroxy-6-metoxy-1,4-benzoquinol methylase
MRQPVQTRLGESPSALPVRELDSIVRRIYSRWWRDELSPQVFDAEIQRVTFNAQLVLADLQPGSTVCDVGGGWGVLSAACASCGFDAVLVDDFADYVYANGVDPKYKIPEAYDVRVVRRDVARQSIAFDANSIDVISCFDSMEHWHHSPRRFLRDAMNCLKPGGKLVLSLPNCVDYARRLLIPLGQGKWSPMSEWYDQQVFRSHVRELDVEDMEYMSRDLGLVTARVIGRNWGHISHPSRAVRTIGGMLDPVLRLIPSLCNTLYLIGRKPK